MTVNDMTRELNKNFSAIQESVPYDIVNREITINGKYAMYIGALEGTLKLHLTPSQRERALKDLAAVVNQIVKI